VNPLFELTNGKDFLNRGCNQYNGFFFLGIKYGNPPPMTGRPNIPSLTVLLKIPNRHYIVLMTLVHCPGYDLISRFLKIRINKIEDTLTPGSDPVFLGPCFQYGRIQGSPQARPIYHYKLIYLLVGINNIRPFSVLSQFAFPVFKYMSY